MQCMAIFNSKLLVYQRVMPNNEWNKTLFELCFHRTWGYANIMRITPGPKGLSLLDVTTWLNYFLCLPQVHYTVVLTQKTDCVYWLRAPIIYRYLHPCKIKCYATDSKPKHFFVNVILPRNI